MLKILKALGVAVAFLSASVLSGFITQTYILSPGGNFGAAIPGVVANFETSLQASITSSATSLTLVKGTDTAGISLSGYMCFTIDEGSSNEEHVCGTTVGTAVTGLLRGIDPRDGDLEVTALKKAHTRGASVKATDYPILGVLARILNNRETLPNGLTIASGSMLFTGTGPSLGQVKYAGTTTLVYGTYQIPTWEQIKDYADGLTFAGTANADLITKGIVEMATIAEINVGTRLGGTSAWLGINPSYLASSNYSTWLPSSDQKNALFGQRASPSASNKFLTVNSLLVSNGWLTGNASASGDLLVRSASGFVRLASAGANSNTFALMASDSAAANMAWQPIVVRWVYLGSVASASGHTIPTGATAAIVNVAGSSGAGISAEVTIFASGKTSGSESHEETGNNCTFSASWNAGTNKINISVSGTGCTAGTSTVYFYK
jgi:hypothetical protein